MDDSLSYVRASLVEKTATEEFYLADITSPAWIRSRFQEFASQGTATIFVYKYDLRNQSLLGNRVEISLEDKSAKLYTFSKSATSPTIISLLGDDSALARTLRLKIVPQIKAELSRYYRQVYGLDSALPGTASSATGR